MLLSAIASAGALPVELVRALGAGANTTVVARVLKYLLRNWAKELAARASPRRKTVISLQIMHGFEGVLGAVSPAVESGDDFDWLRFKSCEREELPLISLRLDVSGR